MTASSTGTYVGILHTLRHHSRRRMTYALLECFPSTIRIDRQAPTIIGADLTLDVCPLSRGEHHRLGPPPSKHHRCGFYNPLADTDDQPCVHHHRCGFDPRRVPSLSWRTSPPWAASFKAP